MLGNFIGLLILCPKILNETKKKINDRVILHTGKIVRNSFR